MGTNLADLVVAQPRGLEDFRGKAIAIDAYNTLYQFLSIIRQPDGTPLMDRQGRITSHLSGVIYRVSNFLQAGIRPVFVFDGEPPRLKAATLEGRAEAKRRAKKAWEEALLEGDLAKARTKASQTARLTDEMVDQAKDLLRLLGLPTVQAPGEGEAQAAHMARRGDVFAAGSQDYDALLFGAPVLVKNLAITGRRKLPRKDVYVEIRPELIELQGTLEALGVTREQLVDMALLIGTDFNEGIKGIGPKKALHLIRTHGRLEDVLAAVEGDVPNYEAVRAIFLRPRVSDEYAIEFRPPDEEGVRSFLCDGFDFSERRIEAALAKVREASGERTQRSLDQWF
jgi:flap endonuclease-1